jgi:EpsI family protein
VAVAVFLPLIALSAMRFEGKGVQPSQDERQNTAVSSFPLAEGEWRGRRTFLTEDVLATLNPTDYFIGDYSKGASSPAVNFYIAYYRRQELGSSIHSPRNCVPAGGWQVLEAEDRAIPVPYGANRFLRVNRMVVAFGDVRQLIYYWFDERKRNLTGQIEAKLYLLNDSIRYHRTDGAMVRAMTPVAPNETLAAADGRLVDFLTTFASTEYQMVEEQK